MNATQILHTLNADTKASTITIEVKSVYGTLKIYPVCDRAKIFAEIAGSKTLTLGTVRKIERLGYQVISMANADYSQAA